MDVTKAYLLYDEFMIRENYGCIADARIHSIHQEQKLINVIIWIVIGAMIGWGASTVMQSKNRKNAIADMITGVVGAFVGGYFLSPLLTASTVNESGVGISAPLVSAAGALSLLAISQLFQNIGRFLRGNRNLFDDTEHF